MAKATTRSEELIQLAETHGAHNYHPLDVVLRRGQGVWVEDVEGNRYIDFLAAYSAVNQGHCHPRLLKVLRRRFERVSAERLVAGSGLENIYSALLEMQGEDLRLLPMK